MKQKSVLQTPALVLGSALLVWACSSSPNVVSDNGIPSGGSGGSSSGGSMGSGASSGTFVITPGSDAGSDDGSGASNGNPTTCATSEAQVALTPLDMALGVDTSYSMDFDDKWVQVRDALNIFAQNPNYANMGVSLQFFPVREQCNVLLYGQPDVPMQVLPGVQPAFSSAVNEQRMFGGTPLVQVMQGMLTYLTAWAKDHPARKPVIVLATDGIPDDTCSASDIDPVNSLDNAVAIAKTAFEGKPSIPVFVIGVGAELTALNGIAKAGGTDAAAVLATGDNVTQKFLAALDDIRHNALACDYVIPPPKTGDIDFGAVNVAFRDGSAAQQTFFYVKSADSCALSADDGWYYDDAAKPTHVVLCPQTCERVNAANTPKLSINFGCKRNDVVR